jgi:hypothetical protein
MWYLLAGVGWIWLRKRQGLPILPDFLSNLFGGGHPFQAGATLIPTTKGIVAIPANTPVMHPAEAASSGLLPNGATQTLAMALQRAKIDMSADSASLTGGAWAMFDPSAGAGPDYRVDELGMPRSNSLASRRWGVR